MNQKLRVQTRVRLSSKATTRCILGEFPAPMILYDCGSNATKFHGAHPLLDVQVARQGRRATWGFIPVEIPPSLYDAPDILGHHGTDDIARINGLGAGSRQRCWFWSPHLDSGHEAGCAVVAPELSMYSQRAT
ncbi:hypothetical protein TCAP_01274 [Tolypocladium capitatum]|uniref:Uncharacterized protein n=1 Tax=Tolypocladium capitatum TaxID=45235 RepID=A0A2K3QMP3_9HYPO|nr:hypothetical protein TCAP_01274 [Tolypocladium capitatum]